MLKKKEEEILRVCHTVHLRVIFVVADLCYSMQLGVILLLLGHHMFATTLWILSCCILKLILPFRVGVSCTTFARNLLGDRKR